MPNMIVDKLSELLAAHPELEGCDELYAECLLCLSIEEEGLPEESQKLRRGLEHLLLEKSNATSIQATLARFLRSLAVNHLGTSSHMSGIRIGLADNDELNTYLQEQNKDEIWAFDNEAIALADLLDFRLLFSKDGEDAVDVTPFRRDQEHRVSNDLQPVILLYNIKNVHWYYYENQSHLTDSDGNCLYNSLAQALREEALKLTSKLNDSHISEIISEPSQKPLPPTLFQPPPPEEREFSDPAGTIAKVKEVLKTDGDWQITEENNKKIIVSKGEQGDHQQFVITPDRLSTQKDDEETFKAMVKSFIAIHGKDRSLKIATHDDNAKQLWEKVCREERCKAMITVRSAPTPEPMATPSPHGPTSPTK